MYNQYLLEEVAKTRNQYLVSFTMIFSLHFFENTHKDIINILYTAISHYVEIFVNTHQYTKITILQNSRIGTSFFNEMLMNYNDTNIIRSITDINIFLQEIVIRLINNEEYKKSNN